MSQSQWSLVGSVITSPQTYRAELSEKKGPTRLRGIFILILVVFAVYIMFFGYKYNIVRISAGDPLEPFKPLLNKVVLGIIGAVLFLLWYLVDRIALLAIIGGGRRSAVQKAVNAPLIASYIPLLPLLALWILLRVGYAGSYMAWGLWWIPLFTVGVTLGWHYFLLHYFASAVVPWLELQVRLKFGLIVWVAMVVGLLATVILVLPYLVEGNVDLPH